MHSLFEKLLLEEITKYNNKKILVAFSGGKDSLGLLDFLNKHKDELNIIVGACYVNHGLRESAYIDEEVCSLYCLNNNIPFFIKNISNELKLDKSGGVEAAARKYRYKALYNILERELYDFIFTAHTYSDNVENFFIDLYTGASIYTLGGIMEKSDIIVRPMLNITTEMINSYISFYNLKPVFDETNNDTRYVRNKVRHNIIPVMYENGNEFEKSIKRIQMESSRLNNYFTKKTSHVIIDSNNITILDKNKFNNLLNLEKEFLLGKIFAMYFRVTKHIIYETLLFFNGNSSKRLDLPNGYMVEQSFKHIKIFHKSLVEDFSLIKNCENNIIETNSFTMEFNGIYNSKKLIVRNRRKGDKFFGKKIKDLFINKHLELFDRDRAVIVEDNNNIIWVEHISHNDMINIKRNGL